MGLTSWNGQTHADRRGRRAAAGSRTDRRVQITTDRRSRAARRLGARSPGQSRNTGWRAIALVVVVLGSTATLLGASSWYSYVGSLRRQATATALLDARAVLGSSLQRDTDLLAMVNADISTRPTMDADALADVLSRLAIERQYPGAFGFTYIERVGRKGLSRFERTIRSDPPLGVPLTAADTGVATPANGSDYCLTRLVYAQLAQFGGTDILPLARKALPFLSPSFNYCSSSVASLLSSSATTGATVVASLAQLSASTVKGSVETPLESALFSRLPLFAMISPVYAGDALPRTSATRDASLRGWTLGLFDATAILAPVVSSESRAFIVLEYRNPGKRPAALASAGHSRAGEPVHHLAITTAPRWLVEVGLQPRSTGASPISQALFMLVVGLLLTALVALLLNMLVRSRRSALVLVEQRTAELRHQALHDALTGLPNRLLIGDRANQLLARARAKDVPVAALFIDLDDFKKVNDTLGHKAGDDLLQAVAIRFTEVVGESGIVGRLGGDEFVVLAEGLTIRDVEGLAQRLQAVARESFHLGEGGRNHVSLSASIGIAAGPRDSPEDLLRDADIALYRAKAMGKECFVVFRAEMHEVEKHKLMLESDLHDAFARDEFFLMYQPIVDLRTGVASGVEALIRWRHPERGIVGPDEFIPVLEASDLIVDVGKFVIEEACRQAKIWHDLGLPIEMSVNVAARQLHYDALVDHVRDALRASGLEARYLSLEVTESMLLLDAGTAARRLRALKRLGVRIAIDDFGTGYSSLAYLRMFPVDILKIDRSFVSQLDSEEGSNFLNAIIQLGRSLGLSTIAEGIEHESQLEHLQGEECERGQGFLFSRPLPPEAAWAMISGEQEPDRPRVELSPALAAGA